MISDGDIPADKFEKSALPNKIQDVLYIAV